MIRGLCLLIVFSCTNIVNGEVFYLKRRLQLYTLTLFALGLALARISRIERKGDVSISNAGHNSTLSACTLSEQSSLGSSLLLSRPFLFLKQEARTKNKIVEQSKTSAHVLLV